MSTATDKTTDDLSGENSLPTTVITSANEKTCIKCKQSKPKAQFKRRLTLAQTRAMLRQPNATTRHEADSKLCKDCQPKRKPIKKLSTKEIRTRMTSGDMHPIVGELRIQHLKEALPKKRAKVMRQYWQDKKSEPYKILKRHLQDQLNRFGNRHFASRNLQDATREQNSWNYQEAKRIMKDLLEQAQDGREISPDIQIASLIKPQPQGESQ